MIVFSAEYSFPTLVAFAQLFSNGSLFEPRSVLFVIRKLTNSLTKIQSHTRILLRKNIVHAVEILVK